MIIISYYTKETPYYKVMYKYLFPSLMRWKLPYHIQGIKNLRNWQQNTHYKATFILECLEKFKQSVVFLDADAQILKYPELFFKLEKEDYDLSLHYLDWYYFWRGQKGHPKRDALSGTLYLAYNKKVIAFLKDWIAKNKIDTKWEQRNMQEVLKLWKSKLKIYNLPIEYIAIKKRNNKVPDYIKDPVIVHNQVSRELKQWKPNRQL